MSSARSRVGTFRHTGVRWDHLVSPTAHSSISEGFDTGGTRGGRQIQPHQWPAAHRGPLGFFKPGLDDVKGQPPTHHHALPHLGTPTQHDSFLRIANRPIGNRYLGTCQGPLLLSLVGLRRRRRLRDTGGARGSRGLVRRMRRRGKGRCTRRIEVREKVGELAPAGNSHTVPPLQERTSETRAEVGAGYFRPDIRWEIVNDLVVDRSKSKSLGGVGRRPLAFMARVELGTVGNTRPVCRHGCLASHRRLRFQSAGATQTSSSAPSCPLLPNGGAD